MNFKRSISVLFWDQIGVYTDSPLTPSFHRTNNGQNKKNNKTPLDKLVIIFQNYYIKQHMNAITM